MAYAIQHTNSGLFLIENKMGLHLVDASEGIMMFLDNVVADTHLEHYVDEYSTDGVLNTNDGDYSLEEFDTVPVYELLH